MLRLQQMDQPLIFLDSKKAHIFSGEKKKTGETSLNF